MGEQSTPDGSKPAFLSPRQIEAAGAARDGGTQIGLTFAPEGEAQTVDTTARRRLLIGPARLRSDARRTAEYLASRGPTPTEALHDVARMKWKVAIREISRHARCTELEAMKMWRDINVALLPFTAARFDTIELGQQLGASGGLALAHFMAASMVAERMSTGPSTDVQSVDSLNIQPLPLLDMAGPDEGPRAGLPPKPDD